MLQLEVPPPPSDEPPLPPRHQPRERWRWAIRKTIRIVRAVSGFLPAEWGSPENNPRCCR